MDEIIVTQDGEQAAPGAGAGMGAPAQDVIIDTSARSKLPTDWPERARLQNDGSVVLQLEYPKQLKFKDGEGKLTLGEKYSSFHMRRLTGDHKIQMASLSGYEYAGSVLSFSTGIDAATTGMLVKYLDAADLGSILKVIGFFQKPGPITGP